MISRTEKKKVLMFCSAFFGYDKRIAEALRAIGFEVDLFDERPSASFFAKACIRFNVKPYHKVTCRYLEKIIRSSNKEYDFVFVIKGEAFNEACVALLRKAYPRADFILYLWDSVANVPDCRERIKLYDRVFSFDPDDSERYGLAFRPLFFAEEYENNRPENKDSYRYAFSFIGTAHTVRPLIVKTLGEQCKRKNRDYYSFLYLPHELVYWYNKLLNHAYKNVAKKDISFSPLSAQAIKSVYDESRCVLDVEHERQRGLTMRTVELVGMKKKIITTNSLVKSYDFYHPNNIFVIDRKAPEVPEEFWNAPYVEIPDSVFSRYSIRAFVRELFSLEENLHE